MTYVEIWSENVNEYYIDLLKKVKKMCLSMKLLKQKTEV